MYYKEILLTHIMWCPRVRPAEDKAGTMVCCLSHFHVFTFTFLCHPQHYFLSNTGSYGQRRLQQLQYPVKTTPRGWRISLPIKIFNEEGNLLNNPLSSVSLMSHWLNCITCLLAHLGKMIGITMNGLELPSAEEKSTNV